MRKMIRMVCLLIAALMLCPIAQAGERELMQHSLSLVSTLDVLAADPQYMEMLSSDEKITSLCASWSKPDRGEPALMVRAEASMMESMIVAMAGGKGMSREGREMIRWRMPEMMITAINARRGTMTMAATTACSCGMLYADDELAGSGFLLLIYPDAMPVAVSWCAQNGAVSLSASYLPDPELAACRTLLEVSAWSVNSGLLLQCTEVQMNKEE